MERQPLVLTDHRLRAELLSESAEGQALCDVAEACGVPLSTLKDWIKKGRDALARQASGEVPDSETDIALAAWVAEFTRARARSRNKAIRALCQEMEAPSEVSRERVYAAMAYLGMVSPGRYSKAAQAKAAMMGGDLDGDDLAEATGLTPAIADAMIAAAKLARQVHREVEAPPNGNGKARAP